MKYYRSGFQERVANIPAIQAEFGSNPIRMYRFGLYPEKTPRADASCVWQEVSAEPQGVLANGRPPAIKFTIQVDIFSTSTTKLDAAVSAMLDTVSEFAKITLIRGYDIDPDTKELHFGFDCSYFVTEYDQNP